MRLTWKHWCSRKICPSKITLISQASKSWIENVEWQIINKVTINALGGLKVKMCGFESESSWSFSLNNSIFSLLINGNIHIITNLTFNNCCFRVWGQNIGGIDVGDTAAAWIEQVLGKPSGSFRLLYHASQLDSRILVKQDDDWMRQCKPQDEVCQQTTNQILKSLNPALFYIDLIHFLIHFQVQYQDGFPYLLISGASLDSLEQSLKDAGVKDTNIDMKQFRPNIEVEGCDAYAEVKCVWLMKSFDWLSWIMNFCR